MSLQFHEVTSTTRPEITTQYITSIDMTNGKILVFFLLLQSIRVLEFSKSTFDHIERYMWGEGPYCKLHIRKRN